jgi:hypothetical protein
MAALFAQQQPAATKHHTSSCTFDRIVMVRISYADGYDDFSVLYSAASLSPDGGVTFGGGVVSSGGVTFGGGVVTFGRTGSCSSWRCRSASRLSASRWAASSRRWASCRARSASRRAA